MPGKYSTIYLVNTEKLLWYCINGDIQSFKDTMASFPSSSMHQSFVIQELGSVMMEAIKQDNTQFILGLLRHGFEIHSYFTSEATIQKAKGALECFIQRGWDINEPASDVKPPVLGYAIHTIQDEEMTNWLLEADISIEDANGRTVIEWARVLNQTKILKPLEN
ncbi:hypothetical protein N7517_008296 [Penicillium concentricum]|uniref:Uncharacterized protein n=1 Tax=Penicillium concentricum TaxID=293559 RepID=A0A9W9V3R1_9EURO|nr:uncharacterized protein N7517_008296 [Penicillium concentricum]KAJ5365410.1 hypothetical protein N7517_008296 [Penicillium concentricum]